MSAVEETQRGRICMLRIAKALYAWGAVDADERIPRLKEALDKLRKCNGVIAVSPVYFGAVTGQLKAFWDLTRPLRGEKALYNKTGAAVSVGASRFGGQESTIRNIQDMMLIQPLIVRILQ